MTKMMEGDEFPMGVLDYSGGNKYPFSQEGLHRAVAAKQKGDKYIPVTIIGTPPKKVRYPKKKTLKELPNKASITDLGKVKEKKGLATFHENLITDVQRAGMEMQDRTVAFFEKTNAAYPHVDEIYMSKTGNRIKVIGNPYMMKKAKEPSLKVEIIGKDGEPYETSLPLSSFDKYKRMGSLR